MTTDRPSDPTAVAEHAPTAHCVLRGETITYANPAMERLFEDASSTAGGASSGVEGAWFFDLVAPADREGVHETFEALGDGHGTVEFEVDGGGRDRRIVESEWAVVGDGGERTLVGTLRDVTERARRRSELERESEMLGSLLENIPMSIYVKDRLSRHERVSKHMLCSDPDSYVTNQEGKRHAHPDDVVGKSDWDLYDPELAAAAVEEDRRVMKSEESMYNEVTESTTNLGETIFTSTTKAPRYDDDGNVIGIVGVTMDVTDRMIYERELERQNDRLEEFTEVLAHDLRNPLNVAQGNVELLAAERDEPRLDTVSESLERMSTLIDEIRSFVIEGRTVESPEPVDLATAARTAWESVETAAATLEVGATHTVRADPDRLRRLLENLYRNAIDHVGPEVVVSVGDLPTGFYVADDGPGIPDEEKDAVFDRGFTTSEDGTGFGLSIVANIAEAHDWSATVEDARNGGAMFAFTGVVRTEDDTSDHF